MKRQLRPFAVEIKSSRPRIFAGSHPTNSADETPDPFRGNLAGRDANEHGVPEGRRGPEAKSEALRTAERAFAGLTTRTVKPPSPALTDVLPASPLEALASFSPALRAPPVSLEPRAPETEVSRPRILPDLSQEARQQEPPVPSEPTRTTRARRSPPHPGKPRGRHPSKEQAAEVVGTLSPAPAPHVFPLLHCEFNLPPLLAPMVVGSVTGAAADQKQARRCCSPLLPRGERWKMRRLPRVCWSNSSKRRNP
jgi:hypothetical protein